MNEYNQKQLETIFANNFASPLFPVLANIYYNKKEYTRALKVCEIGLSHNENNFIGQYILSQIYIATKQYIDAEKILKKIVENDLHNLNALIDLIKTQKKLNRSSEAIQKYINLGINFQSKNKLFNEKSIPTQKAASTVAPTSLSANKTDNILLPKNSIQVSDNMATKTMYSLMIKQQKYDVALSILQIMKANKRNVRFVNSEFKKLQELNKKRK